MTMTMLAYTVLTDPAPLEASADGRSPSMGTVYLVVTNTRKAVDWSTIEVKVPVGKGAGDLTQNIGTITAKGEYTDTQSGTQPVTQSVKVRRQGNVFQATPQTGRRARFEPGDYMVLTLENVTVAPTAGLAVLTVTETIRANTGWQINDAAVPLVKTAPKEIPAPRDFRPDKAMLDDGDKLTLSWEGSADFEYKILYPGAPQPVPVTGRTWSPTVAPKRATTYILIATSGTTPKQEHFLTTTVQVRNPILESLTATTGIDTPWVQGTANATKGRVTFTGTGVEITGNSGGQGTVTADKADLNGVNTTWVQGRNADDGWISFPQDGLRVHQNGRDESGNVSAHGGHIDVVHAQRIHGQDPSDGWISFWQHGLRVHRDGQKIFGAVTLSKVDLRR
ncbi:hypothetical protein ACIBHX_44235 [Nonomuraea sp. NPDC050536]|uniref:hypothetical protein n=1 Tax=Nonomuraea sp. NPDC050536 TaxID=3364366 RepID=UPI0037C916D8